MHNILKEQFFFYDYRDESFGIFKTSIAHQIENQFRRTSEHIHTNIYD